MFKNISYANIYIYNNFYCLNTFYCDANCSCASQHAVYYTMIGNVCNLLLGFNWKTLNLGKLFYDSYQNSRESKNYFNHSSVSCQESIFLHCLLLSWTQPRPLESDTVEAETCISLKPNLLLSYTLTLTDTRHWASSSESTKLHRNPVMTLTFPLLVAHSLY